MILTLFRVKVSVQQVFGAKNDAGASLRPEGTI